MELIVETFFQSDLAAWSMYYGPDLDVPPFPFVKIPLHTQKQRVELIRTVYQRLAVVRKWQGHGASAGEPALDAAEDKPIRQIRSRGTSGNGNGLVTVYCLQGSQPARAV